MFCNPEDVVQWLSVVISFNTQLHSNSQMVLDILCHIALLYICVCVCMIDKIDQPHCTSHFYPPFSQVYFNITYFSHLGEYCTGCGTSLGIGYTVYTGLINQFGEGVNGWEHTVPTVALKGPSLCMYFYFYIINGNTTQRALMPGPLDYCYALGTICRPHRGLQDSFHTHLVVQAK